ncbi:hypothetical protein M0R19_02295 [Candidatus Pacearchaeota archaeon]|nr:hypothetical protein [Candidatus Pacearchaeota archaeon]
MTLTKLFLIEEKIIDGKKFFKRMSSDSDQIIPIIDIDVLTECPALVSEYERDKGFYKHHIVKDINFNANALLLGKEHISSSDYKLYYAASYCKVKGLKD